MSTALSRSFRREWLFLRANPWDMAMTSWVPLLILLFMGAMFWNGVPRNLPIVVVDEDGSSLSRKFSSLLLASPTASSVRTTANLLEAKTMVRDGSAFAAVLIPRGAEEDSLRGEQATIYVFFNNSYYTAGNLVAHSIESAVSTLNAQRTPVPAAGAHVVQSDNPRGPPLQARVSLLFNPQGSYEWGLLLAIFPALLLLMFSACVMAAILREYQPENHAGWIADGGSISAALSIKILLYSLVFTFFGALALIWLYWRGWPVYGSVALTLFGQWLMYVGYGAVMALFVGLAHGNSLTALSLCSMYASPALAFGNALFPVDHASLFVKALCFLLPYSPYIQLQAQQIQINAPPGDSLPFLLHLAGFVVIGLPLACWMLATVERRALGAT